MTSSILRPRRSRAWVSPRTHLKASTMLVLPEPLGPTIAVIPPSKTISVERAKVLKPESVIARRCTAWAGGYQMWGSVETGPRRGGQVPPLRSDGAGRGAGLGQAPGIELSQGHPSGVLLRGLLGGAVARA